MHIKIRLLTILLFIFFFISNSGFSQLVQDNYYKKGNFYAYWGWNRSVYSTSDMHFTGKEYDFELTNVIAKDRQSPFSVKGYFKPTNITIPQYNFRIGYFFHDHYNISIGADHMKYVMERDQTVKINGHIENSGTKYDGVYDDRDIVVATDFLMFEHTDGLNYENVEIRRFDVLFSRKNFSFSANEGLGVGFLLPKTNATLLNNPRNDQFHLSGYGFAGVASLNLTFFKYFFIQSEIKGGFINMPNIRTTASKDDRASQNFWFSQCNIVFGGNFRLDFKNKKAKKD